MRFSSHLQRTSVFGAYARMIVWRPHRRDGRFRSQVVHPRHAFAALQDVALAKGPMPPPLPPMDHYQAMQSAFAHIPATQTATHIASFRLDDDDAIHTATTAQIRKIANGIMRIRDDDRPFMIGFMRGYFLSIEDDEAVVSAVTERYPLGIALTMVAPVSSTKNVFVHNNHRSVAEKVDMYTDVSRPMFIRTVHNLNDSSAVNSGHMWALKTKADWEEFHRSFQIDLDGVSLHTLWGSP